MSGAPPFGERRGGGRPGFREKGVTSEPRTCRFLQKETHVSHEIEIFFLSKQAVCDTVYRFDRACYDIRVFYDLVLEIVG